jgi:predicted metalloprotease
VMLLGGDPMALLQQIDPGGGGQVGPLDPGAPIDPANDPDGDRKEFVRTVLADTEDVWRAQFKQFGRRYEDPTLVLFSGAVESACGQASAAVGPFYCPGDSKVYLDMSFFRELEAKFSAPGDFAQAYVVAHEVGHHVQNLLGYSDRVQNARQRSSKAEANKQSVRLELQADYLAGVWAHHANQARRFLEEGDIEAALDAATAIGDDKLQKQARGYVVPDSFTHGSSAQRVRWFSRGLKTGSFQDAELLFKLDESEL